MTKTHVLKASLLVCAMALGVGVEAQAQSAGGGQSATVAEAREGKARPASFGRRGGRGAMMQEIFARVDGNGDGAVTQAEVDAFRSARLAEADSSGDGALSLEEFDGLYRAMTRSRMVDAFQDLDNDGDGIISQAEMDRRLGNIVARMDRDGDGQLTLQRGRRGN